MSRPMLPLLVLVTLVSLVVTAPAHCPLPRLCRLLCDLSPQFKSRCESCHPGICDSKDTGRPIFENNLEPPKAKSRIASEGAAEKEAQPTPDTSIEDNGEDVPSSEDDGSIDVDDEPSAQQPSVPEESVEEEDKDVPIKGSGAVDGEDAGHEETDASVGDGTSEDAAEPSDDKTAPEENKPEEEEPEDTESDSADPEKTEPEEEEPKQAESEASEPSEPEDEEPETAEDKPEESRPEDPDLQETEPGEVKADEPEPEEVKADEPEPEEVKADEVKPSESGEETEEEKAVEEAEEDPAEDPAAGEPEKSDGTPQLPETDSPEEPKATEPKEPVDASTESDSEDSEEEEPADAAAGPTSRIFSRTGSSSALACLHNGVYRPLHSTWFDIDHCNLHVCTVHGVQTTSLTGACLPPSDDMSQCRRYRPPGQCCYSYDCQDVDNDTSAPQPCYDALGFEHPHNDDWVDDPLHPCVRYFCADGVVVVLSDMRPLCPPPPSHGCVAFQPSGMCCNDFNCTSVPIPLACLDAQGIRRDNGQIWYDNDIITCRKYLCNNGTVELLEDLTDSCQDDDGIGCTAVPVSGRCCPQLTNCSCLYGDSVFLHGVQFPDDPTYPCRRLQCDNGTIVTVDERLCPTLTCSRSFRRAGQCCYECAGCVHEGIFRPEGSFWYNDPERPCVLLTCSNSAVVAVNRTFCPDPTAPNCQPIFTPGECCAVYDCPGVTCPYRDHIYQEGDVWVNNPIYPCDWFTCRSTGVHQVNSTYCPPLIPRDCPRQRLPGECCFTCQNANPTTCFYQGEAYLEGDVWADHPIYPCKWFTCRSTGVHQVNSTFCPPLIPRDCPRQRLPGECCFSCESTGGGDSPCVDLNGVAREEGELYYIDPDRCMLARCTGDEQVVIVDRTKLCQPPLNPNCTVVGEVNCCPQYLCHLMPVSNCTDADGRQREDGEIYATDPERCVLVQCVDGSEDLLVDRSTLCETPDVPDGCIQTDTLDCCPVYDCSAGPVNCVDDSGNQHLEGDMYYDDPDNCLLVECSGGEEVVLLDKTDACDPAPENPACTVEDTVNCCPVYSCPHCTYNGTSYPIGARWWDDPLRQCVRYRCSSQGLVEEVLNRLPCAEVRPGCVPVRDEPACCHHKYNCMFDYHHNLIPMSDLPF